MELFFQQSDEFLCCLASSGDREAEECLVARYRRLVRVCARPYFLAGGDSEDLIQEGMIGLLFAVRSFNPEREAVFRTYAEICVRNRILSAVRSASREKHSPLNCSISISDSSHEEEKYVNENCQIEDPEKILISKEEQGQRLQVLYEKLSTFEKVVMNYYLDGLSCREIAQRIGKPLKSVDNAVQRIRRKAASFLTFGDVSES